MSKLYNTKFKPTKVGIIKAVGQKIGSLIKGKVSPTITKVEPSVAKTKKQKLLSELKKTTQRVKGATARLKQTQFERANPKFKGEDFTFATRVGRSSKVRDKKMGGGMMGRRMGYSGGKLVGNQKKIDVAAPFGTINEKDFAKLRAKKKSGEEPMRDRMKQPLKRKKP